MTAQSDENQSSWWTSDFVKVSLCRKMSISLYGTINILGCMQELVWPTLCLGCGSEDTAIAKHTESPAVSIKVDLSQPGRITYRQSTESHLKTTSSLCPSCKAEGAVIRERDLYPTYRSILNIILILVILDVSMIVCLTSPLGLVRAIFGMSATGLGVLIIFLVPAYYDRKRIYNNELGPFIRIEHVRSRRKYRQGFVFSNQMFMQAFKESNPEVPVSLHPNPHLARIVELDWA